MAQISLSASLAVPLRGLMPEMLRVSGHMSQQVFGDVARSYRAGSVRLRLNVVSDQEILMALSCARRSIGSPYVRMSLAAVRSGGWWPSRMALVILGLRNASLRTRVK